MGRKKRFYRLNFCHHVMLKGNNGQEIFCDDADRIRFFHFLQYASEKYFFNIHGFCLMRNHIHLILEPTTRPLQEGVHSFSFRYARYFNRRYDRKGYFFQGRFRSICIENNVYLKRVVRYLHLNPVEAALVEDPLQYRWSSHRAYFENDEYVWLNKDRVLSIFGSKKEEALDTLLGYTRQKLSLKIEGEIIFKSFSRKEEEEELNKIESGFCGTLRLS